MSAIAGVLRLDGAPADAGLIGRMLDSMSHRGPDGRGMWTSGAVALGHLARHTTPESTTEHQPLAAEDGTLVLVFDGRVDNRDELVRRLDADGVPVRHGTDAEIVLRAWQRWGAECPDRILGDFAFALWDAPHRLLFCARDIVGIRPFCYRVTARGVQFASEPQALLQDADFSPRPNEGMVAEHLAGIVTSRRETVCCGCRPPTRWWLAPAVWPSAATGHPIPGGPSVTGTTVSTKSTCERFSATPCATGCARARGSASC